MKFYMVKMNLNSFLSHKLWRFQILYLYFCKKNNMLWPTVHCKQKVKIETFKKEEVEFAYFKLATLNRIYRKLYCLLQYTKNQDTIVCGLEVIAIDWLTARAELNAYMSFPVIREMPRPGCHSWPELWRDIVYRSPVLDTYVSPSSNFYPIPGE